MAEIRIEHKQRGVLPWILGLALVALVVLGMTLALVDRTAGKVEDSSAREAGHLQEPEKDETPRHLRQWASVPRSGWLRAA